MNIDEARREQLKRHWELATTDVDIAHVIYADDAVLEFPQSGERFEGLARVARAMEERAVAFIPSSLPGERRHRSVR